MDFAQFIVKKSSLRHDLVEDLQENTEEKLCDVLIRQKLLSKKEAISLLSEYIKLKEK